MPFASSWAHYKHLQFKPHVAFKRCEQYIRLPLENSPGIRCIYTEGHHGYLVSVMQLRLRANLQLQHQGCNSEPFLV